MNLTPFRGKRVVVLMDNGKGFVGEFDIVADGNGGSYRIDQGDTFTYINPFQISSMTVAKAPNDTETLTDMFGRDTWVVQ